MNYILVACLFFSKSFVCLVFVFFVSVFLAGFSFAQSSGNCVENWVCSGWSVCTDGVQGRICSDENQCGTFVDKPVEVRQCYNALVCGDSACSSSENFYACPSDCPVIPAALELPFVLDNFWSTAIALVVFIGLVLGFGLFLKK